MMSLESRLGLEAHDPQPARSQASEIRIIPSLRLKSNRRRPFE